MTHPVLDLPMQANDAGAATIRDYLKRLLRDVFTEQECFSGKRPFGNSGWSWDLHKPLVTAGLVSGAIDEDGYLVEHDQLAAEAMIIAAINDL